MEAPLPPAAVTTPEGWPGISSGPFGRLPTPPRPPTRHPRQRIPPETVTEDQVPSGRRSSDQLPPISWSPERLPPRLFLEKYSVPRVVRMSTEGDGGGGGVDDTGTTTAAPRAMPLSGLGKASMDPSVDLSRPILLYRQYRCGRVQAMSLRKRGGSRKGSHQRHWEESGPAIAIPEEYGGWFSLVGDNGQQLAPCFTSIGHVASARLHFFLTRFDLPTYKLISPHDLAPGEKGKSIYSKTTVRSGQVLRLMGVFEDAKAGGGMMAMPSGLEGQANGGGMMSGGRRSDARLSSFLQRLSRGSNGRPRGAVPLPGARFPAASSKYAQCLTQLNEVVFVPLKSPGRFYAASLPSSSSRSCGSGGRTRMNSLLSSSSSASSTASSSSSCSARSFSPAPPALDPRRAFTLAQLLRSRALPVRVHLICGALPKALPSGFTGTLLLEEWHREDVVLACTLPDDGSRCSLLEMELDSRLLLTRPSRHEARISRCTSVRAALTFCRDHAEDWRRNIKVTHHVFQGENRREAAKEDNHFHHHSHNHLIQAPKGPSKSLTPPVLYASSVGGAWKGEGKLAGGGSEEELPYSRVWDELVGPDDAAEENIYAEICEPEAEERTPSGDSRYYYLRAGGGSDGTLSGTMSSSSPEDEFLYDSVC